MAPIFASCSKDTGPFNDWTGPRDRDEETANQIGPMPRGTSPADPRVLSRCRELRSLISLGRIQRQIDNEQVTERRRCLF